MKISEEERERIEALSDLRRFVDILEARGELEHISGVDPHLEMGALYELSLRDKYPPALMFDDIKGCPADRRVLTNVRFSRIFVGQLDIDAVIRHRAAGKWEEKPLSPEEVDTGPLFENVIVGDDVNIYEFPAVKWHDLDGGPYIGTECVVINKDPDSDWVNLGTYRTQMQDPKTLTVFIEPGKHGSLIREKYWSKGLPCPMAVSVGQAPILGIVAGTSSRSGVSEYATAGGRIGKPI
jgi:UbiD family decarboxylase